MNYRYLILCELCNKEHYVDENCLSDTDILYKVVQFKKNHPELDIEFKIELKS